jgi:beta-lactamase superfamily II metal-dependent hydrolase
MRYNRRAGWVTSVFALAATLSLAPRAQTSPVAVVGAVLPPWTPGTLDIHQIATGRGNAALSIFPDGTTMLFDAGDGGETPNAEPKPDATRTPGQWIARYVAHMLEGRPVQLDYVVLSHLHPDHIGRISGNERTSSFGDYKLAGVTEVAEAVPVKQLIDRGYPAYSYLPPPDDAMFTNYRKFQAAQIASPRKMAVRAATAGSPTDIVPVRQPAQAKDFNVRIVSVNDRVWTGRGDESVVRFPALDSIAVAEDRPTENMCSVTLRMQYGAFDYFTGGDMPGYPVPGGPAWHDVETAVAKAIGPTDVHVMNHHGSIEVANPTWLATLKSQVMILPAWQATHPSPDVLKRMLSRRVYPEPRDIFITEFRDATRATIGARATQVASDHGHVVVRVEPGGARFWVIVLDDTTESYRVTAIKGPYLSK